MRGDSEEERKRVAVRALCPQYAHWSEIGDCAALPQCGLSVYAQQTLRKALTLRADIFPHNGPTVVFGYPAFGVQTSAPARIVTPHTRPEDSIDRQNLGLPHKFRPIHQPCTIIAFDCYLSTAFSSSSVSHPALAIQIGDRR